MDRTHLSPPFLFLSLLFISYITPLSSSAAAAAAEFTVDSHPSSLLVPLGELLEGSPGSRPGTTLACTRVHIRGRSRLRHVSMFAHALKVRVSVSHGDPLFRVQTMELCFHWNVSIGVCMCPASQWQKLSKNSWSQLMSPFDYKILDLRITPDPSISVELSTSEEFLLHRVIFLVIGVIMMIMAHILSESVVFYYGSAMTVGVILVILIVLFQGMKLLPTGRKSSLAIFLYSSVVGVATFLLHYLSGLLRSVLVEIGISEDMHNPLGIFVLVCIVLAGAWFGYWGVRKLVLTEEGSVDTSVAYFVEWSILIFSAALILESSLDYVFAFVALGFSIGTVALTRMQGKSRFLSHISSMLSNSAKITMDNLSPSKYDSPNNNYVTYSRRRSYRSPSLGSSLGSRKSSVGDETFYSSFHSTPERRKFTKEEWDSFTKEQTKKAMRELISSPDFNRWALANADRISVTPRESSSSQKRRQWFFNQF